MVMRPGTYQASCNAGELAPELHGNTGLKQYYSGLKQARNCQPVPQGGFDLLPRSRFLVDLGAGGAAAKLFIFTVSRVAAYRVVLTAGTMRIFKRGVLVGSVAVPYAEADIPLVKAVQRAETMLLFHQDYPPRRLLRRGNDAAWSTDEVAWTEMPQVDYGGSYVNTDEKWTVYIRWTSALSTMAGAGFTLSVDGVDTDMVTVADTWADTMPLVQAALEDLPAIDAGVTVTLGTAGTRMQSFDVTFSGGRNSGNTFALGGSVITETEASLTTARRVKGKAGGEPVMSPTRGWPACAVFYQDRLIMGGFRSKSSALLASRSGEYFDLNIELESDLGAMLFNLDTDGDETVVHLVQGRYLGIFTTDAEYFISDRALKRNTPPNIVRTSKNGASERVSIVVQEDSILYASREETIIYAATYDAVSEGFQSPPLSILSSHLIRGVRAAALQVSSVATDAQRYYLPRDSGDMVVACLIRNQDVQPFVRWATDGQVKDVGVDGANVTALLVERVVAGDARLFLEELDDGLLVDAAIEHRFGAPQTLIAGLAAHEGRAVWAVADGYVVGPFVVAGGQITLAHAAASVTVGRWLPPLVETLPLVRNVADRMVLKRPCRVHTVQLDLIATESLAVGANGLSAKDVTFARAGDQTDQPTPPFSGERVVTGLQGFTQDGTVVLTQVRPGNLQVRNVTVQARI